MKKRSTRKRVVTKAELQTIISNQTEKLEWANKIIRLQQTEVDRLIKQNETLTDTLNRFSRKD